MRGGSEPSPAGLEDLRRSGLVSAVPRAGLLLPLAVSGGELGIRPLPWSVTGAGAFLRSPAGLRCSATRLWAPLGLSPHVKQDHLRENIAPLSCGCAFSHLVVWGVESEADVGSRLLISPCLHHRVNADCVRPGDLDSQKRESGLTLAGRKGMGWEQHTLLACCEGWLLPSPHTVDPPAPGPGGGEP